MEGGREAWKMEGGGVEDRELKMEGRRSKIEDRCYIRRQHKASIFYLLPSILLLLACCWLNPYARLDCQEAVEAHFCAVRLANGAGVSVQWGQRQRTTLWIWGPDGVGERRLWPRE